MPKPKALPAMKVPAFEHWSCSVVFAKGPVISLFLIYFFYNLKTTSTSLMSWVRKKCSSNCLKNQQTGNDRNSDCLSIYSIYGVLYFLWKHDTFLAVYCTLLIIMMMIMIMNLHSAKTIEEYSKALSIKLKSMNK